MDRSPPVQPQIEDARGSAAETRRDAHVDGAAWDRSFRQHRHRVVVALLAHGVRADRAEEIAQSAWARLLEQVRDGKLDRVEFPGLAIAQARLLALEENRRDARAARRLDGHAALETRPDPAPDPERRALDREQLRHVIDVVSRAPRSAQALFRLLYAEPPLSHVEAAERLGLSVQRVRQILCELRKDVRRALDGETR